MNIAINAMIYIGTVLMVVNIGSYMRFERYVKKIGGWEKERRILYVPIVPLALFLIGYLFIGIAGEPDLVMAGIMLGGSVFVLVILIVMWRVTKQIHANEQLGAALRAAEQANEAKSVFLANMSHDIRTPLNAILGYTALAKSREMTSEEAQEYFAKIGTAGMRLLELVNDVLEMRRIESGKAELVEEPTDLVRIMDDLRDLFEAQMAQKQLEFRVEVQAENQYVFCDRHKLNMILLNLVSNAWKFTEQGGSVTVSLKEDDVSEDETTADRDVRWYELRVADTGIGMTPEFAAKVFDVFERERTTTSSGIQGTGLGMAIAKNLVELMHGTIRVDTAPGEGTEFTVQLPLRACSEEEVVSAGHTGAPIQSEKGIPFEDAGEKHNAPCQMGRAGKPGRRGIYPRVPRACACCA